MILREDKGKKFQSTLHKNIFSFNILGGLRVLIGGNGLIPY